MKHAIERAWSIAFSLPLRHPWRFGRHCLKQRRGWLIGLRDRAGRTGWGESTPLPAIGTETPRRALVWLREQLTRLPGSHPAAALRALPAANRAPPAARCGLETALLDLLAQQAGLPLARLLHSGAADCLQVNAYLGALATAEPSLIEEAAAAGYRCLKFKVALAPVADELTKLQALSLLLPPHISLRLDANQAWSEATASAFLRGLNAAPVSLLEDPLATADSAALRRLQQINAVPLGLDQTLSHDTLAGSLQSRAARFFILKPMRLGGLLPCLAIARQARAAKLRVIVTTSVDGAIATHAAAHLAAAIDGLGAAPAHGLATSSWLARDIATPPLIRHGQIQLAAAAGLHCVPDTAK